MEQKLIPFELGLYKLSRFLKDINSKRIEEFHPNTVILIGNGAIENGWDPVIDSFTEFKWTEKHGLDSKLFKTINRKSASHCLSIISFIYRLFRNSLLKYPERKEKIPILQEILEFKIFLSKKFQENNNLKIRKELKIIQDSIRETEFFFNTGIITLNWDELFWNSPELFPNLVQLHGRVGVPYSLVFPTDLSIDENILELALENSSAKLDPEENKLISRENIYIELNNCHNAAVHWLNEANKLIIWGVALNEYDAELNSILFSLTQSKIESITIFDINDDMKNMVSNIMSFPVEKINQINPNNVTAPNTR
jgi:hypothetical protein